MQNRWLKKGISLVLLFSMVLSMTACGTKKKENKNRIVVFNYGDYIDKDLLKQFEKETGIDVAYEEFLTPEAMYTKYKSGAVDYDLICCSDYMLDKMIQKKEVKPIDFSKMKHVSNIGKTYFDLSKSFDPDNKYTLPYFWGTVGILYNKKMVQGVPDSWKVLWDAKYRDNIIMQDSVRDSFIPALILNNYSVNTKDHKKLKNAQKMLLQQKSLVQSYLVDEIRDDMANNQAALGLIYSGEASLARDYNSDLEYVVPKEGSNIWMDSFVIPKTSKNTEGALKFLDFLCRKDVAKKNFDYVYYSTPNEAVLKGISKEEREDDPAIFPTKEEIGRCEIFKYLGKDSEEYYNRLWKELKVY